MKCEMNSSAPVCTQLAVTDWAAVLIATSCGVAVAMNVGKVPIALGQLREEFGFSLVTAGWVASMTNMLAVFTAILFGIAADRIGHLYVCETGLGISILASIGGLVTADGSTLLILRFVEGAGFVLVAVSAPALISSASTPSDRHLALSVWGCYLPTGVGLAMLTAPALLPHAGWRGLWVSVALVLSVAALALHRRKRGYRPLPPHSAIDRPLHLARQALAQPTPWLLAFAFATFSAQHSTLIVWLPTFLHEERGLSPLAVSILSFLMAIANVPGNLLGGKLLQRNYRRGSLIAGASLFAGLADLGIFLDFLPDALRYLCCVMLSFAGGLIPASVMSASTVIARTPRQVSTLQGLFMQGANLGPFFAPPLIAFLVARSGHWHDALILTGSAALAGLIIGLLIRHRGV